MRASLFHPRLALISGITGVLLIAIFSITVMAFRSELAGKIRQAIIGRDAAVLYTVADAQLREAEEDPDNQAYVSEMLLPAVLKVVRGMRGGAIFDVDGNTLRTQPVSFVNADLTPDERARLLTGERIANYYAQFPLDRYFTDERGMPGPRIQPILEVLLPIHARGSAQPVGFVKFLIDGSPLAAELNEIDSRVRSQTVHTLAIGCGLIALVVAFAYAGLLHAQRLIAERNERLTRANFELTLAAKTSALGVITSHLIHGLQGPVAGLRAVVADQAAGGSTASDWQSAANYTERMQTMIHETVALLGDTTTQTSYELSGTEVAATIRTRNSGAAAAKGVLLEIGDGFPETLDSHRGSLICLVATNLAQNAIEATDPGRHVRVRLTRTAKEVVLTVTDEGRGIPEKIREHLFEPGRTGRAGGTGLGLAISQLLSRQIGGSLELVSSGPTGTEFRLTVPLA